VCRDDILRAVEALKPLGSGFAVIELGRRQMIRSVPKELNTDQTTVLEAIQVCVFSQQQSSICELTYSLGSGICYLFNASSESWVG
jgi:hypothetical protein